MTARTIVLIAPDMHRGGSVGAVAWRHAMELAAHHKVFVITRAVPPSPHPGVHAITVRTRQWKWLRRFCHVPIELDFVHGARRALRALCQRETVHVVWCHSHAATALVAAPLKSLGFQVVMTTHGDIFDRPAGTYSPELTLFYRRVTPLAYQRADWVQVLSPYMADWAIRGGARQGRVRVIPNAVDPSEIGLVDPAPRAADTFLRNGMLSILYVGSLWKVKGVDVLLRALALLAQRVETSRHSGNIASVRLVVVGEGVADGELRELALDLGIAHLVEFRGRVQREALSLAYAKADVLCVPSRSEALSLVTLEAMLCGLPVVATRTGGLQYLIEDGVTGCLVPAEDAESLARALAELAATSAKMASMGEQGLRRAAAGFSWRHVAGELHSLIDDACPASGVKDDAHLR
jgi:glycosyltransferase involved in cell wall biosynthesis